MAKIPEGFTPPLGCEPDYLADTVNHVAQSLLTPPEHEASVVTGLDTASEGAEQAVSTPDLYLSEEQVWALSQSQITSAALQERVASLCVQEIGVQEIGVQEQENAQASAHQEAGAYGGAVGGIDLAPPQTELQKIMEDLKLCQQLKALPVVKGAFIQALRELKLSGVLDKLHQVLLDLFGSKSLEYKFLKDIRRLIKDIRGLRCIGLFTFDDMVFKSVKSLVNYLVTIPEQHFPNYVDKLTELCERIELLLVRLERFDTGSNIAR